MFPTVSRASLYPKNIRSIPQIRNASRHSFDRCFGNLQIIAAAHADGTNGFAADDNGDPARYGASATPFTSCILKTSGQPKNWLRVSHQRTGAHRALAGR